MIDANAEADRRDAGTAEARNEIMPARVIMGEGEPRGENDLATLEVRAEIEQLGDGDPVQLGIVGAGLHEAQAKFGHGEQL